MKTQPGICRVCFRKLTTRGTICRTCRKDEKEAEAERDWANLGVPQSPNQNIYERMVNELDSRDEEDDS